MLIIQTIEGIEHRKLVSRKKWRQARKKQLAKDTGIATLSVPQTSWDKTTIRRQPFLLAILVLLSLFAGSAKRAGAQATTPTSKAGSRQTFPSADRPKTERFDPGPRSQRKVAAPGGAQQRHDGANLRIDGGYVTAIN
jgi:hypothetical protein